MIALTFLPISSPFPPHTVAPPPPSPPHPWTADEPGEIRLSRKNKEERVGAEYLLITDYVIWMVNNNKYIQAKMEFIGPERIAISVVTLA